MKWVSDDYPMTSDGTKLATGKDFASEEFCAKSGCRNGYRVAESEVSVREIAGQTSAARWLGEALEVAERDGRLRMGFEGSIGMQRQGARCEDRRYLRINASKDAVLVTGGCCCAESHLRRTPPCNCRPVWAHATRA